MEWAGDRSAMINGLKHRVRPVYSASFSNGDAVRWIMGTFIPAAPSTKWSGSVASVVIELFDKLQIVDEAKTTEPYSKAVGTNVTSTVQAILTSLGQNKMRSEEHKYELQSLMRISYVVFCL